MGFHDPVIDERFCKTHTLHMGQTCGVLHGHRIGNCMVDDYGYVLLKNYEENGIHYIVDAANNTVATFCRKPTSFRVQGWTLYRGRSKEEQDTICKSEQCNKTLRTYIYMGSAYKGKHQSKIQKPDYFVESFPAITCKYVSSRRPFLLAHQVHNMCVSSTNSGPKIRVSPGADYVFVYALNFIHKAWYDLYSPASSLNRYGEPPPLPHTFCSCRYCAARLATAPPQLAVPHTVPGKTYNHNKKVVGNADNNTKYAASSSTDKQIGNKMANTDDGDEPSTTAKGLVRRHYQHDNGFPDPKLAYVRLEKD